MFFALPKEYREATADDLRGRIRAAREKLGKKLVILVHHYQRLEVVEFGDHIGDSYGLSKIAAKQSDAGAIGAAIDALEVYLGQVDVVFVDEPPP